MDIPIFIRWAAAKEKGINLAAPAVFFQETDVWEDNVSYRLVGLIHPNVHLDDKTVLDQIDRSLPVSLADNKIDCQTEDHLWFGLHAQFFPYLLPFPDIWYM